MSLAPNSDARIVEDAIQPAAAPDGFRYEVACVLEVGNVELDPLSLAAAFLDAAGDLVGQVILQVGQQHTAN